MHQRRVLFVRPSIEHIDGVSGHGYTNNRTRRIALTFYNHRHAEVMKKFGPVVQIEVSAVNVFIRDRRVLCDRDSLVNVKRVTRLCRCFADTVVLNQTCSTDDFRLVCIIKNIGGAVLCIARLPVVFVINLVRTANQLELYILLSGFFSLISLHRDAVTRLPRERRSGSFSQPLVQTE